METGSKIPNDHRDLLGLRPPAQLAETPGAPVNQPVLTAVAGETPARPEYPIISSGWEDEDTGPASKTSDLMTAVRAGLVLLAVIIGLSLLIG